VEVTTTTSNDSTVAIISNDKTIIIIITTRTDTEMLRVIEDFVVEVQIVWNTRTIISALNL
jgi:hypothetical protein